MDFGISEIEAARRFMVDNTVGWIDPDGDVHPVDLFTHLAFFHRNPSAIPVIYEHWKFLEQENSSRQEAIFREKYAGESHIPWHDYDELPYEPEYDIENDGIDRVFVKLAYDSGWGRVGSSASGTLELECSSEHEKTLTSKARKFAELIGRDLVVRINDVEWVQDHRSYRELSEQMRLESPQPR